MTNEKTAAEKFCEIASWLKKQDNEFTKNFVSMKSIMRLWKAVPEDCKSRKVQPWLSKNSKTQAAQNLMLAVNAEFGFRYFNNATYRYFVKIGLSSWTFRNNTHYEVRMHVYDRYEKCEHGDVIIKINDLGDAKRAAERLVSNNTERYKNDMELTYGDKLKKFMKNSKPTQDELQECCEIVGL